MDLRGNWNYPTTVRFGAGRVAELPEAVSAAKMRNPLFVTDPVLAKMPMTQKAMALLRRLRKCSPTSSRIRSRRM